MINRTETGSSAAYLIAPQAPAGSGWFDTPLRLALDLVEQFAATRNVDPSRIYITGLSMGGFGTFEALESRPSLFAAAVPMSGGGDPAFALTYAQTPIWAFHGSRDTNVLPSYSRNTITAIENAGGSLERYTELAGSGTISGRRSTMVAPTTTTPTTLAPSGPTVQEICIRGCLPSRFPSRPQPRCSSAPWRSSVDADAGHKSPV